jgi:hypothetical protein
MEENKCKKKTIFTVYAVPPLNYLSFYLYKNSFVTLLACAKKINYVASIIQMFM